MRPLRIIAVVLALGSGGFALHGHGESAPGIACESPAAEGQKGVEEQAPAVRKSRRVGRQTRAERRAASQAARQNRLSAAARQKSQARDEAPLEKTTQ
jgi:hypothetical protein